MLCDRVLVMRDGELVGRARRVRSSSEDRMIRESLGLAPR